MDSLHHAAPGVDFGVFSQLTNYGALGLAALALGYVTWFFIKRNLAEKDRMQKELEDWRRNNK